jgi:gliding motility-associated protein GldE
LLAGVLIGNNFVNISIVLIFTYFNKLVFDFSKNPSSGFIFQVIIITAFLLLFGEIMPKIFAKQAPMTVARFGARPLSFIILIFSPLIWVLTRITSIFDKRLANKPMQLSMEDLSDVVSLAGELSNKDIVAEDHKILKGIATFGDTEVKEIMKARVDVKAVDYKADFNDIIQHIQEWGYSRIPVFLDSLDQIKGVLYIKDLLSYLHEDELNWVDKIRPAFFVPENKKINDLLNEFRAKKIHLAIVVDEYGGTSGIVTLEDVLEEIVGEISDEFDEESDHFQYLKQEDGSWIFEGKSSLLDFCKVLEINDELLESVRGESDSLAGLILELKGDFPKPKEIILFDKIEFEILKMDKRRISRIRVRKL